MMEKRVGWSYKSEGRESDIQSKIKWGLIISIGIIVILIIVIIAVMFNSSASDKGGTIASDGIDISNLDDGSCISVWECTSWSDEEGLCGSRECIDRSDCPLKAEPIRTETNAC